MFESPLGTLGRQNMGILGLGMRSCAASSARRMLCSLSRATPGGAYASKVSQIVDSGAAKFFCVHENMTVFAAVQQMVENECGSLIVNDDKTMVGIITERDYLRKIITMDRASKTTKVKEVMTRNIISVDASATIGESMRIMTNHNIRHLPVLANNEMVGVVSMRTLVKKVTEQHHREVSYLKAQIDRMAVVLGQTMKTEGEATL